MYILSALEVGSINQPFFVSGSYRPEPIHSKVREPFHSGMQCLLILLNVLLINIHYFNCLL